MQEKNKILPTIYKGQTKNEVNAILKNNLFLVDDIYNGSTYKHNWKCSCGREFQRTWTSIKNKKQWKCRRCLFNVKYNVNNIEEAKLLKGMKKNEINQILNKIIHFEDPEFNGTEYKHKWRCTKCNNTFVRKWGWIQYSKSTICIPCSNNHGNMYKFSQGIELIKSIKETNPNIASLIVYDKDGNKPNLNNICPNSNKEFYFQCPECNKISKRSLKLNNIVNRGYSCEFCSDGVSLPEKYLGKILTELNIEYFSQVGRKTLNWIEGKYLYDFYIPSINCIIETHGRQHYEPSWKGNQNNDFIKYKLSEGHVDKYIIINCRDSEYEWLTQHIIDALKDIFPKIVKLNLKQLYKDSQSSKVVQAWDLYKEKYRVSDIAKELHLNRHTISRYIKRGNILGII